MFSLNRGTMFIGIVGGSFRVPSVLFVNVSMKVEAQDSFFKTTGRTTRLNFIINTVEIGRSGGSALRSSEKL